MTIQAYQFAGGYGVVAVPNPPISSPRDPISNQDILSPNGNPYQIGQYWRNFNSGSVFEFLGGGTWVEVSQGAAGPVTSLTGNSGGAISPTAGNINILGAGALAFAGAGSTLTGSITPGTALVATITGDSGGALSPTAGNINILGTANQITVTGAASTETLSIPAAFIAPGSIEATTTVTATLGNITATNGNFVASTAGTGLVLPVTTASGASPQSADGRVGSVTFTGVSIASGASQSFVINNTSITGAGTHILYSMTGATAGSALSIESVTNAASSSTIVVTNGTSATMVTSVADITFTYIVLD